MSSNKIVLKSSDGQSFEIDEAVARESQIIAHIIDDGCVGPIPLQNVTGKILSKVIEYCKKHVEARSTDEDEEAIKTWDAEFMMLDIATILDIVLAANYLSIDGLIDLTCQNIADYIKDKQPEEVRKIFNIENDITPEEEAQMRKENAWAFV